MAQQTAVQWLIEQMYNGNLQCKKVNNKIEILYPATFNILELALEKERQQSIEFAMDIIDKVEEDRKVDPNGSFYVGGIYDKTYRNGIWPDIPKNRQKSNSSTTGGQIN